MYDNSCNAHAHALNRDPAWFGTTEFYVDEPHYAGHKNCSLAYNTGKPANLEGLLFFLLLQAGISWGARCGWARARTWGGQVGQKVAQGRQA